MVFFSDRRVIIFSVFAIIYTVIEIFIISNSILKSGTLQEYVGIVLLPVVVCGELLIILWERNKISVSHFPYSILLQDVGGHYGIAGNVRNENSNFPSEETLRILIRRKGSIGKHYLNKIIFETRPQYNVEWAVESEIPIEKEDPIQKGNLMNHGFSLADTLLKESQVVFEFYVRRLQKEGLDSYGREVYCNVTLYYTYELLFGHKLTATEDLKVPSSISR